MNIKSLSNIITPTDTLTRVDKKAEVKAEQSGERDADGRRQQDSGPEKHSINDEELQIILEALKSIPGVMEHDLIIRPQEINNSYFFFIEDNKGKVIRRLNTKEAWAVHLSNDQPKGQLLDKSM